MKTYTGFYAQVFLHRGWALKREEKGFALMLYVNFVKKLQIYILTLMSGVI
jgi:hypothetical protein